MFKKLRTGKGTFVWHEKCVYHLYVLRVCSTL